ncbi:hypothetical protein CRG98_017291 [Punica granatum]|uniref:Uncharacterized protein n=1 Tax=Punica granatum TaxID=22663 RepID=A0A2I0K2E1_PUNGR|nr:hypothetical protein CRG98_017291 [Punica granatum]
MAASRSISIIMSLMILALVMSPAPPCHAARLNERVLTGPICPACVCCSPPPPGSCCECCTTPVETSAEGSP